MAIMTYLLDDELVLITHEQVICKGYSSTQLSSIVPDDKVSIKTLLCELTQI